MGEEGHAKKGAKDLGFTSMTIVDLPENLQTRTVHPNKSARRKPKQGLGEVNVSDEGHVRGLATADSSSVVLRDKREIEAGWIQNAGRSVSLSAGRAFMIEIFE